MNTKPKKPLTPEEAIREYKLAPYEFTGDDGDEKKQDYKPAVDQDYAASLGTGDDD